MFAPRLQTCAGFSPVVTRLDSVWFLEGSEHAPRTSRAAKAGTSCVVFIAYSVNCIAAMIVLLALTIGQRRRDSQTLGREPHSKARLTSWPPLAISRAPPVSNRGRLQYSRRCRPPPAGRADRQLVTGPRQQQRRRFLPNLQETSLLSDVLGLPVRMRLSTRAIRTIEHNGGIDAYLLGTPDRRLTVDAKALKRRLLRARRSGQPAKPSEPHGSAGNRSRRQEAPAGGYRQSKA